MSVEQGRAPILFAIALLCLSCTFGRMLRHGSSGIEDHDIFPGRDLPPSSSPAPLEEGPERLPTRLLVADIADEPLVSFLAARDTTAFLALKDGRLIYEGYWNGGGREQLSLSFSTAKAILSILIGAAIDDGLIRSIDQPVTDFVPELAAAGFGEVTIEQLLNMNSGSDYHDSDNPLVGDTPWFYYTDDLPGRLLDLEVEEAPGTHWEYKSGDSQLLGLVLARALAPETITDFTRRRLWEPLGMEYGARWSVDRLPDGLEKTFCCLAARARDFAKIGLLMQDGGEVRGRAVVSKTWVQASTTQDETRSNKWRYRHQWWFVVRGDPDFVAVGHLGQYIYVNPATRVVFVRLGTSRGGLHDRDWRRIFHLLSRAVVDGDPAGDPAVDTD